MPSTDRTDDDSSTGPLATHSRPHWQKELADAVRDADTLCDLLQLPDDFRLAARESAKLFPVMVPRGYLQRMRRGDPSDPLLRQVLPVVEEQHAVAGAVHDAVGDLTARRAPGLLQKYAGRALLIMTGACAVHCRYCFRRHYPYSEEPKRWADWAPAFRLLQEDTSIREVILSGGDPLMLTDQRFSELCDCIEEIPHIDRLRVHTRLPIVLPSRLTLAMVCDLADRRFKTLFVVHANHPAEIDDECARGLAELVRSHITTLNQAVLLRGVNDDASVLVSLSERLVNLGVLPYYLHQLDRVAGVGHFEVPIEEGRRLIAEMRRQLPGYAVPEYVQEIPGEPSKSPI